MSAAGFRLLLLKLDFTGSRLLKAETSLTKKRLRRSPEPLAVALFCIKFNLPYGCQFTLMVAVPLVGAVKVWLLPPSQVTVEPDFLRNLNSMVFPAGTLTS